MTQTLTPPMMILPKFSFSFNNFQMQFLFSLLDGWKKCWICCCCCTVLLIAQLIRTDVFLLLLSKNTAPCIWQFSHSSLLTDKVLHS